MGGKYVRLSTALKLLPITMLAALAAGSPAMATGDSNRPKPKPLELQDEGSFFVNGEIINTDYASGGATRTPGRITTKQMYVHYRIPMGQSKKWPVVMVHGAGHTGMTFETTPDGREGWATYFVRQGHPVYVIDAVGRGRSGFSPVPINQGKVENNSSLIPSISAVTIESAWATFRFGPQPDVFWPDSQFPTQAVAQYFQQLVPLAEGTVAGGGANTSTALGLLLDKIGPSIILAHSLGSTYGRAVQQQRPGKVKAFIDVEGRQACAPVPTADEISTSFKPVPFLFVAGDHDYTGEADCRALVDTINAARGNAKYVELPEIGIRGNDHMMMMDKNNLKVADVILKWIDRNVKNKGGRDGDDHDHDDDHGHGHGHDRDHDDRDRDGGRH
jgi:pimeloyl-ACP methyl ester carboxylesterase